MGGNKIIGYHGTDQESAEKIVSTGSFLASKRDHEWLGHGVYFFAYKAHAEWWTTHNRFHGKKTNVVQAEIEYQEEQLLDLDDPVQMKELEAVAKKMAEESDVAVKWSDYSKEKRWCMACNAYRAIVPEIGIIKYTFPWNKMHPYVGLYENQQQICVSNHSLIVSANIA